MVKKRNSQLMIGIFGLLIAGFAGYIGLSQYQLNVQTNQASIDYYFSTPEQYIYTSTYSESVDSVTINCKNGGNIDGDFALIVTFNNSSFSTKTEQPYSITNNTDMTFRWILHKGESASRTVYYTIDHDAPSYSISLSIEKYSSPLKDNAIYPCSIQYRYNTANSNYELVHA